MCGQSRAVCTLCQHLLLGRAWDWTNKHSLCARRPSDTGWALHKCSLVLFSPFPPWLRGLSPSQEHAKFFLPPGLRRCCVPLSPLLLTPQSSAWTSAAQGRLPPAALLGSCPGDHLCQGILLVLFRTLVTICNRICGFCKLLPVLYLCPLLTNMKISSRQGQRVLFHCSFSNAQ